MCDILASLENSINKLQEVPKIIVPKNELNMEVSELLIDQSLAEASKINANQLRNFVSLLASNIKRSINESNVFFWNLAFFWNLVLYPHILYQSNQSIKINFCWPFFNFYTFTKKKPNDRSKNFKVFLKGKFFKNINCYNTDLSY